MLENDMKTIQETQRIVLKKKPNQEKQIVRWLQGTSVR